MDLPAGPTSGSQTNTTGTTTVTPLSQNHTETVTFTGGATARVVSIDPTGLIGGGRITIVSLWPAATTDGIGLTIQNANGNQLFTFTRSGGERNASFVINARGWGGLEAVEQVIPSYPIL